MWRLDSLDFYDRPNSLVYRLIPPYQPSVEIPPEVIVVGKTFNSAIVLPPKNWLPWSKRHILIANNTFKVRYAPVQGLKMKLFPMCKECGFNAIFNNNCIRCKDLS